jgi:CMP/dCMP kinase
MIRVVVVEREFGAGGGAIAKGIADRLGFRLWDRELTCEIARRYKCDISAVEQREEKVDPTFYRLMRVFMRGSYEEQIGGSKLELLDAEQLTHMFERVQLDLAAKGSAVIVGRGAPWFLRNRPDTFSLFVFAPFEEKLRRTMASGLSRAEAEELLGRIDNERAAFVKKFFNKNWPCRDLYHLMVNSKFGDDLVIDMVLHEIETLNNIPVPVVAAR